MFSADARRFWILATVVYFWGMVAGLSSDRPPARFFDYWAANEGAPKNPKEIGRWKSPSGGFSVVMMAEKEPNHFVVIGENMADKGQIILGYGDHGADVKWVSTRAGDIVVINNFIDNGTNEIVVVMPPHSRGQDSWTLLYRTPDVQEGTGHVVAHCYWQVVNIDRNMGSLKLKGSWDYSDVTNAERRRIKTEGTYDVPMFYGYK